MTADTDMTPGATTTIPSDATARPLRKRKLADREIIERRARGDLLRDIAADAGIGVPTLSIWLRRPEIAKKLADHKHLLHLERQHAKKHEADRVRKEKAEKRRAREAAKQPEPEPEWVPAVESYAAYVDRQARAGKTGRLLKGFVVHW
jgi:hypothetical protein